MKKAGISSREVILLVILALILIGAAYYLFFYSPLQNELASIDQQCQALDSDIQVASVKIQSMDAMQAELDEILARPEDEITEIAPYDNAKVIMSQLNGILSSSLEYEVSFADPKIDEESGFVRRNVNLSFSCTDYNSAKTILKSLSESRWRCLISGVDFVGTRNADNIQNVLDGIVNITATLTFFESTNLS